MAVVGIVAQYINQPCPYPAIVILWHFQRSGNLVHPAEINIQLLVAKAERVLPDAFFRIGAVPFPHPHRFFRGNPVFSQTNHHILDAVGLFEILGNFFRLGFGHAFDLCQTFRVVFDNVQRVFAEGFHNPGSGGSADSFNRAGG